MTPMEPWRNSTPFFGAAAFCMTKIDRFRARAIDHSVLIPSIQLSDERNLTRFEQNNNQENSNELRQEMSS